MAKRTFNLYGEDWDGTRDRDGWRVKAARFGQRIGGRLIGASMFEVEPGNKLWPYHTHHANEEWVIVLRGEPTLRTPAGEQVLREGDVACFPRGKDGAHQILNRTDSRIRLLMLSTMIDPETVEYLDTGKILVTDAEGEDILFARPGPPAEYWEGEEAADGEDATEPRKTADLGGEAACFAQLVCPDCGVVVGDAPHRPGCEFAE